MRNSKTALFHVTNSHLVKVSFLLTGLARVDGPVWKTPTLPLAVHARRGPTVPTPANQVCLRPNGHPINHLTVDLSGVCCVKMVICTVLTLTRITYVNGVSRLPMLFLN